jgi:CheY-like chemotaxis protein
MMTKSNPILIIEDSDEDFEIACWAIRQTGNTSPIERASRAEEVLARFSLNETNIALPPALILLDLNLPGTNGREILSQLRQSEDFCFIPIVIVTTSTNPRDIEACYRLGASGYIGKPLQLEKFLVKIEGLINYWFSTVTLPLENIGLHQ